MLTIGQLACIFYVLYTALVIYKQVFVELADKTSAILHRVYRTLLGQNLLLLVIGATLMLIYPNECFLYPNPISGFLLNVYSVLVVAVFPVHILAEILDFYEKNPLSSSQKRWIIGSQILCVLVVFLLILR